MRALLLEGGLTYRTDVPEPLLGAGEALIRLNLAGICATDLQLLNGYAGFSGVPGHEFVGVVAAVNEDKHRHWLGRRVVGSINIGCNHCETCMNQGPEHCLRRTVLGIRGKNGVFADYFSLPVDNLHVIPDDVSDREAVFTEPLAAALRVVEQLRSRPFGAVAVLGPGRLGLLIAKVLSLAGYQVTVLGRSEAALVLPRQWQLVTALVAEVPDNGHDCVVDATGTPSGFAQALRILRPLGTLILKSTFSAQETIDLSKIVVAEIHVLGSRCGSFADALAVLRQKTVAVEELIDGCHALQDGLLAFEQASRRGVRKILLQPD